MSLVTGKTSVKASMSAQDQKSVTGYTPATQSPELAFSSAPNTTTYAYVLTDYGTIAASANTTVDFYSFTTDLGESVTATKLAGFLIKASPTNTSNLGGQLRIQQGTSNPATLFLSGTAPTITIPVNTNGACLMMMAGTHETLSSTVRNMLLSNPGTNTITYYVYGIVGT